jgi:hypothetical protein
MNNRAKKTSPGPLDEQSFFTKYMQGLAIVSDLESHVAEWEQRRKAGELTETLPTFLGLTPEECDAVTEAPNVLPFVQVARDKQSDLEEVIQENIGQRHAARASDSDGLNALREWLIKRQKKRKNK